ncbi:MAG: hypothetical protein P4L40_15040 [Terracidiphilus sp.]|nr:hypothetical protein [Terracidiphilus sp.]
MPLSPSPSPQGIAVREGLQILYRIVRDKSIFEALLFAVYLGVFMFVAFAVRGRDCACCGLRGICVFVRAYVCGWVCVCVCMSVRVCVGRARAIICVTFTK